MVPLPETRHPPPHPSSSNLDFHVRTRTLIFRSFDIELMFDK